MAPARTAQETAGPRWGRPGIGTVTVGLALAVALQRHLFTSPSPAAGLLALAVLPWALLFVSGVDLPPSTSPAVVRAALWSAVVMGATFGLMVGYPVNFDYEPFFLIMLAGTVTAVCGFRYGVGVGVAVALTLFFLDRAHIFGGSVIWIAALVVSVLGSAAVRNQAAVTAELPAAQADLAARAAAEERHRLARDIHDLIAHSLAVTMLHLTGARLALKDGDTGEAEEALDEAERTGRQAMGEIRRTVGLLGPGDFGSSAAPTPKAVDLPGLIGDFRAAGLQVDLDVTGNLESIPLTPGLALYRIVQESLSNVVKHAPGQTVHLGVETTDGVLRVAVSNPLPVAIGAGDSPEFDKTIDGANALAGDGVRGMTERAQLLEGRLRAGPQAGSWVVDAKIPLEVLSS